MMYDLIIDRNSEENVIKCDYMLGKSPLFPDMAIDDYYFRGSRNVHIAKNIAVKIMQFFLCITDLQEMCLMD